MHGFVSVHSGNRIVSPIKHMKSWYISHFIGAGTCADGLKYKAICSDACRVSVEIIRNGGSALQACEEAISVLENDCSTNAGFGSNLTWDKTIELEASIMDGSTLNYGACTNVNNLRNPIKLAKILCERQSSLMKFHRIPPMILAGEGASKYAKEIGFEIIDPESLISSKALHCYEHYMKNVTDYERVNNLKLLPMDTVGAVTVDNYGNIAAGCSSGGLILKLSGRVGQASSYGAGCWSQKSGNKSAATCTSGNGEYLIKTLLAKEIATDLLSSSCPITSLHETFNKKFLNSPSLKSLPEVYGGALSLLYDSESGNGDILWSHTTKSMCIGYQSTEFKKPKVTSITLFFVIQEFVIILLIWISSS